MKIHLHDNCGHAFAVELSRALAVRGHQVIHTHMAHFQGPKGLLELKAGDPPSLRIEGLNVGGEFPKYSLFKRWWYEQRFGRILACRIRAERPDIVIASNTPLDVLQAIQRVCARESIQFVCWTQDLLGPAMKKILSQKLGWLGEVVGSYYKTKEDRLLRSSSHAIAITEDFLPYLPFGSGDRKRVSVIHNWAPIADFPAHAQNNTWSRLHGLADKFVFLYSGTLGLKHNPAFLYELACRYQDSAQVRVVVISEGIGADWLRSKLADHPLPNLEILPFQPVELLPEVMGSASVLVSVLEADAGVFSVPSKVLSYFCAARPVLLSAPPENLAARLVEKNQAGLVAASGDKTAFMAQADRLYRDGRLREHLGVNGRRYAEENFDIDLIAARFEGIFHNLRKSAAQAKW